MASLWGHLETKPPMSEEALEVFGQAGSKTAGQRDPWPGGQCSEPTAAPLPSVLTRWKHLLVPNHWLSIPLDSGAQMPGTRHSRRGMCLWEGRQTTGEGGREKGREEG